MKLLGLKVMVHALQPVENARTSLIIALDLILPVNVADLLLVNVVHREGTEEQ